MEKLSDHHPGGMDYITFQINFSTIKENIWNHEIPSIGLLICTLISESQGFEKSRSALTLRKISDAANLGFLGLHLRKKLGLY